jgi:Holliday junction resolvase RusA-like endonuclease
MMMRFVVPGEPKAKGRQRFSVADGRPRAFTPERTVRYENLVALFASEAAPSSAFDGCIRLTLDCYFTRPKKYTERYKDGTLKNGAVERDMRHTSKPDADNVAKSVLDGMNQAGNFWRDDSQVSTLIVRKWYADIGDGPRVEVTVEEESWK